MKLDDLDRDRPDQGCEPQQARSIARNLQLDETKKKIVVVMRRTRTHISPSDDTLSLVPPEELYEVCDEDAVDVDVDVEDEPESDGPADAAHGAAGQSCPRSAERPATCGKP